MCLARGVTTPATVADHIIPHRNDPNSFILGAVQSLCASCHNRVKKQLEKRGYDTAVGSDGYPIDPRHPAYAGAATGAYPLRSRASARREND
jgi:hypothetical protein